MLRFVRELKLPVFCLLFLMVFLLDRVAGHHRVGLRDFLIMLTSFVATSTALYWDNRPRKKRPRKKRREPDLPPA